MRKSAVIALGWALAGCAGEAVDLGDDGQEISFEGEWVGSLESYLFVTSTEFFSDSGVVPPPSSKTLHLTLDGGGHGSLLVGDVALPPPTDPNVGYPPEAQADAGFATGMFVHLYDGVSYALENVMVSGNTLHLEIDPVHAFDAFCALQTPIETESGEYRCREPTGSYGGRPDGQELCRVGGPDEYSLEDCVVAFLCRSPTSAHCECTASECRADSGSQGTDYHRVRLDLALNATRTALAGGYTYWGEDPHPQGDPRIPAQRLELRRR